MKVEKESLAGGGHVMRTIGDDGKIVSEHYEQGGSEIALMIGYRDGVKTGEVYFIKRQMVGRQQYEEVRAMFPGMPPADMTLEDEFAKAQAWALKELGPPGKTGGATPDVFGALMKVARAAQRERTKAAKSQKPNPEAARQIDSGCEEILERGARADAVTWIKTKGHTIGEYTESQGGALIGKLVKAGAKVVHACDIDGAVIGDQTTNHLVVELPKDPKTRATVFKAVGRIVNKHGFDADRDDGQRYAYIFLD